MVLLAKVAKVAKLAEVAEVDEVAKVAKLAKLAEVAKLAQVFLFADFCLLRSGPSAWSAVWTFYFAFLAPRSQADQ